MNPLDYHVLLALAGGPLHGYGIKEAVALDSGGTLGPPAGTFYRVIARLVTARLVTETAAPAKADPHPGLARRYYVLSAAGRRALEAESRRLKQTAATAAKRLRLASGRS